MNIKVKLLSGGVKEQNVEVSPDSTYEELLESLNIDPEIVLVFINGTPVPLDARVADGNVDILRVVTGG